MKFREKPKIGKREKFVKGIICLALFIVFSSTTQLISQAGAIRSRGISVAALDKSSGEKKEIKLYNKSYAVIIGIDQYKNLKYDQQKIIKAYRSQFIIEDVFKEKKDRSTGSWWPLYHWTDSKISVHGLYCTIALLLRALILRRVRQAGIGLSMKRVLAELDTIKGGCQYLSPQAPS